MDRATPPPDASPVPKCGVCGGEHVTTSCGDLIADADSDGDETEAALGLAQVGGGSQEHLIDIDELGKAIDTVTTELGAEQARRANADAMREQQRAHASASTHGTRGNTQKASAAALKPPDTLTGTLMFAGEVGSRLAALTSKRKGQGDRSACRQRSDAVPVRGARTVPRLPD